MQAFCWGTYIKDEFYFQYLPLSGIIIVSIVLKIKCEERAKSEESYE